MQTPTRWVSAVISATACAIFVGCAGNLAIVTTKPIPQQWVQVSPGPFSFWVPHDLKEKKVHGIDSLFGQRTSSTMTLYFDYMMDIEPLVPAFDGRSKCENITLDGHAAVLGTSAESVGLKVKPDTAMSLFMTIVCKPEDRATAFRILRSVKFTPPATEPGSK